MSIETRTRDRAIGQKKINLEMIGLRQEGDELAINLLLIADQVSSVWNNSLAWARTSFNPFNAIWVSLLTCYTISSVDVSALCKRKLVSETNGKNFLFFLDRQGDGVEQNEAEAVELIKLSAEQVTLPNVCILAPCCLFYIRLRSSLRVITHKNVVWLIVIWMQQKQVWPIAKDACSQISQSEGKTNRCSRVMYGKMKWPIISFSFSFNCCKSVFSLSRQTFRYFIDKSIISRLLLLLF